LEVAPPLVPVEELTRSSSSLNMLPKAVSEALGISLSKVLDLYFGELDEVRRDHLIWEAIGRHRDDSQERRQFEENSQKEREAELRSYYEDDMF
jgi:hypothetical protein